MTIAGWMQIAVLIALVGALVAPLGGYMAKVFAGERTIAHAWLAPIERVIYRMAGVDPAREQGWLAYALSLIGISRAGGAGAL
jgi:K+-transporting ATPase ATPase A chain